MDNHQEIIDLIKSTPASEPPEGFTPRVMARLSHLKPSILFRIKQVFIQPRKFDFNLTRVMAGSAGNSAECAFAFFMIGFFYLTMGFVLLMGLKGFIYDETITHWIKMQPQIVLVKAVWLIIQGVLLFLYGKMTIRAAEIGILFFIGFAVINGFMIMSDTPVSLVFAFAFAGTGLMMGIFLGFTVWKYQKNMQIQKGYSG